MLLQKSVLALLFAMVVALLGGCHTAGRLVPPNFRPPEDSATALEQAKSTLQGATPCCTSFADFSFQNPLPWRPRKFLMGPGSLVVSINGEKSYAVAFRLPTDTQLPYRVAFKAELNGRWLRSSYLFAPTITLLDEAFQPIRSEDLSLCEHMGWTSETTGAFGAFKVEEPTARYVVLYSSARQQGSSTYWEQSPAAFSAEAPVKMASAGNFKIPHGPDGTIWVGLMNKTFEDAVDNAICAKPEKGDGVLNTLKDVLPSVPLWPGATPETANQKNIQTPMEPASSGTTAKPSSAESASPKKTNP